MYTTNELCILLVVFCNYAFVRYLRFIHTNKAIQHLRTTYTYMRDSQSLEWDNNICRGLYNLIPTPKSVLCGHTVLLYTQYSSGAHAQVRIKDTFTTRVLCETIYIYRNGLRSLRGVWEVVLRGRWCQSVWLELLQLWLNLVVLWTRNMVWNTYSCESLVLFGFLTYTVL